MSFVISDTISPVLNGNPAEIKAPPAGTNTNAVDAVSAPVQLGGGTVTGINNGTPGSTTASNIQTFTTAPAAEGQTQQVLVTGAGTRVNVNTGKAVVQAAQGGAIIESVQDPTDTAPKVISLGDTVSAFNGVAVNTSETVSTSIINPSTGEVIRTQATIGTVSGGQGGPFAFYAHGGFGNDQMEGSSLADFIRGGSGNDTINAFAGNDLIRGGIGSDSIFGGAGQDTLYYTADQFPALGSQDTDTFADFTSGQDAISIDRTIVGAAGAGTAATTAFNTASITGIGTSTVTFSGVSGRGTVLVVSGTGQTIAASDINFI